MIYKPELGKSMELAKEEVEYALLQRNSRQLADSMAQLTAELRELKDRKKAFLADINPRIKELEEMIEEENAQWKLLKGSEEGA